MKDLVTVLLVLLRYTEGDFQAWRKLSLVPSLCYGSFLSMATYQRRQRTKNQFLQQHSIAVIFTETW